MRRLDARRAQLLGPLLAALPEHEGGAEVPAQVVEALLEAMFLMAVADGEVNEEEIRQFARSCEGLFGDVSEADLEGMFLQWAGALSEEGWEPRMRSIASAVAGTELGELAFRLAVAIAVVDDRLALEESDGIEIMAHALGIAPERSRQLVREIHAEIFASR